MSLLSPIECSKAQALASGKKQAFIDKMVEGRLKKYYEEVALLDQKFVVNDTQTVQVWLFTPIALCIHRVELSAEGETS